LAAATWASDVADRVTPKQGATANSTDPQSPQQSLDSRTNLVPPEETTRLSSDEVGNEKQNLVDYYELELS